MNESFAFDFTKKLCTTFCQTYLKSCALNDVSDPGLSQAKESICAKMIHACLVAATFKGKFIDSPRQQASENICLGLG